MYLLFLFPSTTLQSSFDMDEAGSPERPVPATSPLRGKLLDNMLISPFSDIMQELHQIQLRMSPVQTVTKLLRSHF